MEAYAELLSNVAKTVDQFMGDNVSDNNARDWLVGAYPQSLELDTASGQPMVKVRPGAEDSTNQPDFRRDLNLPEEVSLDDQTVEEVLVPGARRRIAQSRQQTLATMVLMGMNRIVITRGRIKAGMGFRIDTTDRSRSQLRLELRGQAREPDEVRLVPVAGLGLGAQLGHLRLLDEEGLGTGYQALAEHEYRVVPRLVDEPALLLDSGERLEALPGRGDGVLVSALHLIDRTDGVERARKQAYVFAGPGQFERLARGHAHLELRSGSPQKPRLVEQELGPEAGGGVREPIRARGPAAPEARTHSCSR